MAKKKEDQFNEVFRFVLFCFCFSVSVLVLIFLIV